MTRIAEFYSFVREREAIRLRRAAGQPWPWTDDPILRKFSFTNVHREHDRTSAYLIRNFYDPHKDDEPATILFNAAVFRYFGTQEFARAVGWSAPTEESLQRIHHISQERILSHARVYTGAYIVTNAGRPGPKHDLICYSFLADLLRRIPTILLRIKERWSLEDAIVALRHTDGFGTFVAKEVLLDTTYTSMWPEGTPSDRETWTAMGPGARRGAGWLKYCVAKQLGEREALEVALEVYAARHDHWIPLEWGFSPLRLQDIQFQLCEMWKYEKTRMLWGRPRSRYHPPEDALLCP